MLTRGRHSATGWSLVETLVAAGIILVLVALAWPASRGIIEGSQGAGCISNLRQIGAAALQYAADNNGPVPPVNDQRIYFQEAVAPY
ncbi:MAG: hypothetical protein N2322_08345, partial [Terrimicrobiaceae bacterium]|nr:hypothetical protein [Terrimicrobiaceae bacterium]